MSRTKGSKNVPRVTIKEVVKVEPKIVEPFKEPKVLGHSMYVPQPDMGNIKPPSETHCHCKHGTETHYGGARGHCNFSGCPCLEFK